MKILAFLITAVLVPMLVSEFTDWLPWLAVRLVRAAARALPPNVRLRYADEWLAELDAVPGKLSKLALAIRIFVRAPAMAAAVSGLSSFKAVTVKALFDKMAATSALFLLAPLFIAIAVAIKIGGGGPVLCRQLRVGRNGRPFNVYKFRTMMTDAELERALLAGHSESNGMPFKGNDDPRITKAGSWLRRFSLDELPQLINVLVGDMSLVGPRPVRPDEAVRYPDRLRRRFAVKPGISGLWQVSGRSDRPWEEAVRLDVRYVEGWSLLLDLRILCKTWLAVIYGDDAY